MGVMTSKKFREWSDRWSENFRHYYFVKKEIGYFPSLCHFTSKYKGKYEVIFDDMTETPHIVLPKDDYYHEELSAQKAIRKELERVMANLLDSTLYEAPSLGEFIWVERCKFALISLIQYDPCHAGLSSSAKSLMVLSVIKVPMICRSITVDALWNGVLFTAYLIMDIVL
ncbi:hypothetical protein FAGAP_12468 [Fusarium agapanthi]|uniref:Uncharacterized protein n=1 Tax=Fusarium agapanthi TaxID=1803897 RepID=A0A9P5AXD8_9HYPO|nr:hypothetical protein FAGAP_12468 [Fusarium agapanthi]